MSETPRRPPSWQDRGWLQSLVGASCLLMALLFLLGGGWMALVLSWRTGAGPLGFGVFLAGLGLVNLGSRQLHSRPETPEERHRQNVLAVLATPVGIGLILHAGLTGPEAAWPHLGAGAALISLASFRGYLDRRLHSRTRSS